MELEQRTDPRDQQLIDVAPHVASRRPHLLFHPAADRVEQLQADELWQTAQTEHPVVDRLAGARRPRHELSALGTSRLAPEAVVQLAQPHPLVGSGEVARGGHARTEAGKGTGLSEELLEGNPASSVIPPGGVVTVAELPSSSRWAGAALAGLVGDHADLFGHPPALERRAVARQPHLQVLAAGTVEAAAMGVTERIDPATDVAAAHHRAGTVAGEPTLGVGDEQQPLGVPLALEEAVLDERGHPLDPRGLGRNARQQACERAGGLGCAPRAHCGPRFART